MYKAMANSQHRATFASLLRIWGFPQEEADLTGLYLSQVDNGTQDMLIEIITRALEKKQSPK